MKEAKTGLPRVVIIDYNMATKYTDENGNHLINGKISQF
jgi:hypothetical protein